VKSEVFDLAQMLIPGSLHLVPTPLPFLNFPLKLCVTDFSFACRMWVNGQAEFPKAPVLTDAQPRSKRMKFTSVFLLLVIACGSAAAVDKPMAGSSRLSNNDELLLPGNYRNWVTMSPTTPGLPAHQHGHMAGKLYVEPSSYEQFRKTGVWPNRTVIVLELRTGKPVPKGACDVMGLEAAMKDDSRFPDPWSYYGIVYDRPVEASSTKLAAADCTDCEQPLDTMLAMAFPTLRAVINAKPSTMSHGLF